MPDQGIPKFNVKGLKYGTSPIDLSNTKLAIPYYYYYYYYFKSFHDYSIRESVNLML